MKIITKFTIATEQGVAELLELTKGIIEEKFSFLLDADSIEKYRTENWDKPTLIAELNSMSNQFLVVYVDDQPAGFARITSKGKQPSVLENKRSIRIADFGILQHYNQEAVRLSLFEKCLTVSKFYDNIWIYEYVENPFLSLFEKHGFIRQEETFALTEELPLPFVCLIK